MLDADQETLWCIIVVNTMIISAQQQVAIDGGRGRVCAGQREGVCWAEGGCVLGRGRVCAGQRRTEKRVDRVNGMV